MVLISLFESNKAFVYLFKVTGYQIKGTHSNSYFFSIIEVKVIEIATSF